MIGRIARFLLICGAALPVWLILRRPWKGQLSREIALGCFALLMTALLSMVLEGQWAAPARMLASARERMAMGRNIHLTPFHTIGPQLKALPDEDALIQLLGNTVLFMPWGFFLPLLWRCFRGPLRMAGMALLLTVCIETVQLFIGRTVDVDDLLLNFLGSMAGTGLWGLLRLCRPQTDVLAR